MPQDCKQYTMNYLVYRRTKAYNTKKQRLLNSLPIPNWKWVDLSLDFVINLPEYCCWNETFQHILVVVNKLTKQKLYKLVEDLGTSKFIDTMHCCIFSAHGYPLSIMNDCRDQMMSKMWRRLCKKYGIKIKFSSGQHSKINGRIKNAKKVMKNYLRAYVSYTQNDWVNYLPIAKFLAVNHINKLTRKLYFLQTLAFIHVQVLNCHIYNKELVREPSCWLQIRL